MRRDFRKVLDSAGLTGKEWAPRELRHSFVSLLSDHDIALEDISRLVGHSNTVVTETVYRHQIRPVIQEGATAMAAIFPLAEREPWSSSLASGPRLRSWGRAVFAGGRYWVRTSDPSLVRSQDRPRQYADQRADLGHCSPTDCQASISATYGLSSAQLIIPERRPPAGGVSAMRVNQRNMSSV
ncbi:tyrosine-type recombinase/integrase [Microbispora tritici]|nr:tyrosine-type recombinase/integrase [Microbispora tritici]